MHSPEADKDSAGDCLCPSLLLLDLLPGRQHPQRRRVGSGVTRREVCAISVRCSLRIARILELPCTGSRSGLSGATRFGRQSVTVTS